MTTPAVTGDRETVTQPTKRQIPICEDGLTSASGLRTVLAERASIGVFCRNGHESQFIGSTPDNEWFMCPICDAVQLVPVKGAR